jgi:hypothetical protein
VCPTKQDQCLEDAFLIDGATAQVLPDTDGKHEQAVPQFLDRFFDSLLD